MVQNGFSVGFRNMQGMHNGKVRKINEIMDELSNDIEILAETWGCKCELDFEHYFPEYVSPQKHMGVKKGRDSGGFIVLFKNYLAKNVKIIKKSNNFVWIEVDKKFISEINENLLIAGIYIHDITSTYYNDNIFEELDRDILKFSGEGTPILFTGDFNARIGNLNENYEDSGHGDQHIPISNTFSDIPNRNNCDCVINSHGEKVIKFCKAYDFKILNGRMKGDKIGNFTHVNANKGTSTIDYSLCNQHIYKSVENFMVLPINELSDHSKISTVFKSCASSNITIDNYKWKKLQTRFKWNKKSIKTFGNNLLASQNDIDEISQRIDAGLIESTGEKIQNLYFNVAKKTLEQKGIKIENNWKKRKKSKKWFDEECHKLKKDVRKTGREKHRRPNDNLLNTKYHEKLKEFKKKCKSKEIYILAKHIRGSGIIFR